MQRCAAGHHIVQQYDALIFYTVDLKRVDGKCKPFFSLEIASLEGSVKFFIYTPQKFKADIEANLFGQYPDVEIHEVQDYVALAPYLHERKDWEMAGCTYSLTKPDPYPIKTYVDYGLDSTQTKEEMKSDPISSVIEYMGASTTMMRWTTTKPNSDQHKMKWIDRADARPPKISSSQGQEAFIVGDMARPVRIISGMNIRMTTK